MTMLHELAVKPLWWRRLRVRFVAVLGAIGLFCVASSGYFVGLTVHYLDQAMSEQAQVGDDAIELASSLYREVSQVQRDALALQGQVLAAKLAAIEPSRRAEALEQ